MAAAEIPTPAELAAEIHTNSRRAVLMTRALHAPGGLTAYEFTKGMGKDDSMRFWQDAKALHFVTLGKNERGTKLLGLRSEVVE